MNENRISQLDLPLKNLVHKAEISNKNTPSIFFLHGFGSNMQDLFGLTPFFGSNWNCISLQASIPIQHNGWGWAELDPLNIRKLPNPDQIKMHYQKVIESIDETVDVLNLDRSSVNLLGFSQGASLSIYCGLNSPERFNTITALCGYVPEDNIRLQIDTAIERNIDIFMGNGTSDQLISIAIAHASRDYLNSLDGVNTDYKEYESEHTISNDCLNDVVDWLGKKNDL